MQPGLKIISVDDEEINLLLISELGREIGLEIMNFTRPVDALEYSRNNTVDIALIDYMMPEMNGIDLIREISSLHPDIPVVMITAVTGDEELKLEALQAGATEFLNKPLKGSEFIARLKNLVQLRTFQIIMKDRARLLKIEVERATGEIVDREVETLEVLGMSAEYKDPETAEHINRVAHYSKLIAESIGEDEESAHILYYTAPLHDIGKIGIPDSILLKPGKLNKDEWKIMKTHTTIGYNIMKGKKSKFLQAGTIIALNHHERFDGKGYPAGLQGKEIPLYGRIVALCDVFDALNSQRTYKEPWSFEKSLDYVKNERGKHFDPDITDAFIDRIKDVRDIYESIKE